MDEYQRTVAAFWRFFVKDIKDQVWEDIKDEVNEQYDFDMIQAKYKASYCSITSYQQKLTYVYIYEQSIEDSQTKSCAIEPDHLAEKALACLAIAQERQSLTVEEGYNVCGIDFRGHYATFWKASFTHEYLHDIRYDPYLPINVYVLVKHSDVLDLTECDKRKAFAGIFLGCWMK
ncbi:hypothetical protein INT43_001454 [Umbelopsis isabellina]|uniref:Uncharacterized protein n=1 Tax=Mortierella isabellina TaxID=91625 RepID=A0A8H7PDN8_MORIS|nr:hypothetical protein INT43_001454 [Umbelopsis isabellina]